VSNGPGEISGWVIPLAKALRHALGATLHLALPPCQYATGREAEVATRTGLFHEVLEPGTCVRLALGTGRVRADCVVHLGGDLWYAARLAHRAGCPAIAYVERTLIARRHASFAWIGTNTEALARRLVGLGVPESKVEAVGELRADAIGPQTDPEEAPQRDPVLLLLPGSRPQIFRDLAPLFVRIAERVRAHLPSAEVLVAVSPFLPPDLVARVLDGAPLRVVSGDEERYAAYRRAALALTLPGTSTLELALLHTPMLVWLPLYDPARVPVEGLLEWVGRLPGGRMLKAALVRRQLRRPRVIALPNHLAGERVVEELVGDAPVEEVAERVIALLRDPAKQDAMRRALRAHFPRVPGAADRIARRIAEWAG
jgi:hypothetical protein